jgi:hypothetical protein
VLLEEEAVSKPNVQSWDCEDKACHGAEVVEKWLTPDTGRGQQDRVQDTACHQKSEKAQKARGTCHKDTSPR